ncbi:MAG: DUF3883 domain-containing protein [Candidatus Moraniibacteriota bacterium]
MKNKSDKLAKEAFVLYLVKEGYSDIKIVKAPADIVAFKDSVKYYFEIKKTAAENEYFGAATLTEWRAAYSNPDTYFFVICVEKGQTFDFILYSPEEFEKFSTIPPFKIFFNVPLKGSDKASSIRKNKSAIRLSKEKLNKLDEIYTVIKD